ncbi:YlxQ-related RNA-binding protein [Limosilactobacillus sp.]|uniref:YlxQ-related RNA-binding protein n=1 Tax=Limosilactobacillus sp. TaxID=2773925 RepID=UPI00345EC66C
MTNNQVLSLLGLARRARQIETGEGTVLKAIRKGKSQLVFLASDAGAATAKELTDKCNYYHVALVRQFTASELSDAIGMTRKIISVNQAGFANKMKKIMRI